MSDDIDACIRMAADDGRVTTAGNAFAELRRLRAIEAAAEEMASCLLDTGFDDALFTDGHIKNDALLKKSNAAIEAYRKAKEAK